MPMRPPLRADLLQEVQDWDHALKSEDPSVRAAFAAWIRRSPEHLHAYLQHLSLETEVRSLDREGQLDLSALLAQTSENVVPLLTARPYQYANSAQKPFLSSRPYAIALMLLLTSVAIGISWWTLSTNKHHSTEYVTAVGEQRRIALPDGSIIELNTQSHVLVAYSRQAREVELVAGEALFSVQHNQQRPFRVRVRETVVEDVGTQFSIYLKQDNSTIVSVLDGRVQLLATHGVTKHATTRELVRTDGTANGLQLGVGQAIRLDALGRIISRGNVNLAEAAAWIQHRMWFENSTIQEIASEFNRYNTRHFYVVNDPAVAAKRYTASWDPYDPDSFMTYLQNDPALSIQSTEQAIVIRGRGDPRK